ncbi:uncharacterized protein SCHCODRAFT_02478250, partial [Schizophyllum commune H4-8]|uniref:uncharacterized protein n=1 Tax=Schizophyllum commune (strain H4-8 / FGSC 9210) TaxID=578458 RepID=UPI00215F8239
MPWLRKHNPNIDWNTLTIQLAPNLRAVVFEPEPHLRSVTMLEELPRDEPDWVGEAPQDPRVVLEEVESPATPTPQHELAWDEPNSPRTLNSKQRKR